MLEESHAYTHTGSFDVFKQETSTVRSLNTIKCSHRPFYVMKFIDFKFGRNNVCAGYGYKKIGFWNRVNLLLNKHDFLC